MYVIPTLYPEGYSVTIASNPKADKLGFPEKYVPVLVSA